MSCALDNSKEEQNFAPDISIDKAAAERKKRADEIVGTERRVAYFHWKADYMLLRFRLSMKEERFVASNIAAFGKSLKRVLGFDLPAVFSALSKRDPNRQPFSVVDMRDWNLEGEYIEVLFRINRHTGMNEETGEPREYWGNITPAKEGLYRARWALIK